MQHPYHDPRARDPRDVSYHMGAPPPADPRRQQMSPNTMVIQHSAPPQFTGQYGPPPQGGPPMEKGQPPYQSPYQPPPGPEQFPPPSSRRNSIEKPLLYSADLGAYQPLDEELLTLPNDRRVFLSKHATTPRELQRFTPLILRGPSHWFNPYALSTPDPSLHDTPLLLPKINLTGVFYEDALVKQEKYLNYLVVFSGERGYWRLEGFERRGEALREMFWMAMNGFSTVWCGAHLSDSKLSDGGVKELVLCRGVEECVGEDDAEGGVGGVIG